ncbi:aldehyde dehydrogenase [Oceanirhabdus sp. W0125-5]|uniref:aldehyde dehydrogenase n=1 Tax=Oceanirhabdus sp. W0125-5 TaxID=2999116 RepID=UPI0022F2F8B2|nr:aldehyde dehydrogenase [Oceanirhabdus sp. W0125-5]WBW94676.1 aldehyde dehydrogenase [Oceanirhabdus sp. W0125-5]
MSVDDFLNSQKDYFLNGETLSYEFRINSLKKLKASIKNNEELIMRALKEDLGKCEFEAYTSEIGTVYEEVNFAIKHLKDWMKDKKVSTPLFQAGGKSFIHYEPKGTVLIASPWNYPFNLTMIPLIGAIAGGNTVLLKTSATTYHTSEIIKKLIIDNFDEKYIKFLTGGNNEVLEIISSGVDYIFFTGSIGVGKIIMEHASKNLTPLTLELGGKSPVIVCDDANIEVAAQRIAWGKFLNCGQTCIAPDYLYVHKDVKEKFIHEMIHAIESFYGNDASSSPDYGRIVTEKQFNRIIAYLDKDKIVYGGNHNIEKLFISPTIMDNITFEDKVMSEEIFGPIAPIIEFSDLNAVIREINCRQRPLAAYFFTEDQYKIDKLIDSIHYGGGCVNDVISHITNVNLPFGGNGLSGMGSYHGYESFLTFSHKKSIMKKSTKIKSKLPFPPYNNKIKLARKFMK